MKLTRDWGLLLVGVWLTLTGAIALFGLSFANLDLLMALLALATGAVILLESFNILKWTKAKRTLGMILLGVWFLLSGLLTLTDLRFSGQEVVLSVLALLAGILVLLGR